MAVSLLFWAELSAAFVVVAYVLYAVSKHMGLRRQDKKTAAFVAVLCLAAAGFYRPLAFLVSAALIKSAYGCSWGRSFSVFLRAAFLSLPVILLVDYFLGGVQ